MTKDEVIKEAMEKLGAELFPRGIENRLRFVYNEGLKAGRLEIKYTEESMQQEYQRGYEDGSYDHNVENHCAYCFYEPIWENVEPCKSCMYSHGSCFKLKEPKKVKTNADKFEEVFGYMPEVFNAVRGTGLDDWWNEPYKEENDG